MRVASDVGGTFTDLVYYKSDPNSEGVVEFGTAKADTTPPDFENGVLNAINKVRHDGIPRIAKSGPLHSILLELYSQDRISFCTAHRLESKHWLLNEPTLPAEINTNKFWR